MKQAWTRTSIIFTAQHLNWLRALAQREDTSGSGWIRRQIKIAAQIARLPGAVKRRVRRKP